MFPLPIAVAPVQPAPSGHDDETGHSLAPTCELESRPPNGSLTRTVHEIELLLISLCSVIELLESESESRLGAPATTVVVVVELVVVVGPETDTRAFPMMSG